MKHSQTPWVRFRIADLAALFVLALAGSSCVPARQAGAAQGLYLDQGPAWVSATRDEFYSTDQGSRLIPLRWIQALPQPGSNKPFMADGLARYGYLDNPNSAPPGLPVGFTTAIDNGDTILGLTCAACHTRQIVSGGVTYRIDGGPGFADFGSFMRDLDVSVQETISNPGKMDDFAARVFQHTPAPIERDALAKAVDQWNGPFHLLISKSVPPDPWGPARMDAIAMVFNHLAGLDLGPAPDHTLPENLKSKLGDAPTRYPFLWNAPFQNKTQWTGFAGNGDDLSALARNLGEVYGLFAQFAPAPATPGIFGIDYLQFNSANFRGLRRLEDLTKLIRPPSWPWNLDAALAAEGAKIYARRDQNGCQECHEDRLEKLLFRPWNTLLRDVGTDQRQHTILAWSVEKTGSLQGAGFFPIIDPLEDPDANFNVLRLSVTGTIAQHTLEELFGISKLRKMSGAQRSQKLSGPEFLQLFPRKIKQPQPEYEARVLQGIWAAAPYLHNGSVPTLQDLLSPVANRPPAFPIGPEYDPDAVGLARKQASGTFILQTTDDCDNPGSGNSRCGHLFGTTLSPPEKQALLEYLKSL